jgi:Glycine cleavage system H protein (lipoate-binding)
MGSEDVKTFMGYLWVQQEDNIVTIGINEDGLEDFEEITSVELPAEQEQVEADSVIATIETDDGPLDIYTPVSGTVIEINTAAVEDPSLIMEDPFEEGWLVRIEADEDFDEDEDDEDDDDDDDEDEDDDYEDDED